MNKKNKDVRFDKRAAKYDDGFAGKASRRFYDLLLKQTELFTGAAVLDVGCGTGTILRRMADVCSINGFGIDVEDNMINEAKKKCPQMVFQVSRCDETTFDNQFFDIITACMSYHHFDNKDGFAKEASRLLKTGGVLHIADPRFPRIIRQAFNGLLKLFRVTGQFFKPDEIAIFFSNYGFESVGFAYDGYAQVVSLRKK